MTEANNEEKAVSNRDQWRERIAEQERSGVSVRRYCEAQGIGQHLFYYRHKRLRKQQQPMRFDERCLFRAPLPKLLRSASHSSERSQAAEIPSAFPLPPAPSPARDLLLRKWPRCWDGSIPRAPSPRARTAPCVSGSLANESGNTFSATSHFSRVSRALYTSPMPPAPMSARIS